MKPHGTRPAGFVTVLSFPLCVTRLGLCALFVAAMSIAFPLAPSRAAASSPSLPPEGTEWAEIRSPHFTFFSSVSEKRTRKILTALERFRATLFSFHAKFAFDPPKPTLIYVFKSEKDYAPYAERLGPGPGNIRPVGSFVSRREANYVTLEANWGTDASRIVFHEFLHQFLSNSLPNVPPWFSEGMAEYYSTFRGDEDTAKVGLPVPEHLAWLAGHPLIPLYELFRVEQTSFESMSRDRVGTFYAESWALVHYLLNGPANRSQQLGRFLDSLLDEVPLEEAFRTSFQTGYGGLEAELKDYVAGKAFIYTKVDFAEGLRVDTRATVTPMRRDEVLARLGDLLAHLDTERSEEAVRHCEAALQINPENALAESVLGVVEGSRMDYEAAANHYRTASEMDPENHLYPYLEAVSLLGEISGTRTAGSVAAGVAAENMERIRNLLRASIRLKPGFAEAHAVLGATYVGAGEAVDPGITALEKARSLLPSRMDVVANLASLLLQKGDRRQAGDLVENVLAHSGDSGMIRWARRALELYDAEHLPPGSRQNASVAGGDPGPEAGESEFKARQKATVEFLEKQIREATDPRTRESLEERLRQARESLDEQAQVAAFNEAVERANRGDYSEAIGILEKMLPEIKNEELLQATRDLLTRLKEDEKKYGKRPDER